MIFHLPSKLFCVSVSNALWPFSSCVWKPGFTPMTLKSGMVSPMPRMMISVEMASG